MATDFLLREQFVTNPSHVISQYVAGERLSPRQETALNHVIFSVAASPSLLTWLRGYALHKGQKHVPFDEFIRDFSAAVASHPAPHVVNGLVNAMLTAERQPSVAHLDTLKTGLLHVFGRAPDRPGGLVPGGLTGTDDTFETFETFQTEGTWTGTGTEYTWTTMVTGTIFTAGGTVTGTSTVTDLETWHTGTDTTGTDTTGTETTGTETTGTEMTGTERTGTEMTGTEMTGTELTGTESTGTESTGTDTTGTDSTGTDTTGTDATGTDETGTETTGTDSGIWGNLGDIAFSADNYAVISLIALSQYAQLLARSGALAVGRSG
jgi:hypothetical protein